MHEENPQSVLFRDILTFTETESRLSLVMTSNKTSHFQTTANHHRFIKVWTSIADLPSSKLFFWKKYGSEIPYLPMICTYVQFFFFFWSVPLSVLVSPLMLLLVLLKNGSWNTLWSTSKVIIKDLWNISWNAPGSAAWILFEVFLKVLLKVLLEVLLKFLLVILDILLRYFSKSSFRGCSIMIC